MSEFRRKTINLLVTILYECMSINDVEEAIMNFCEDTGISIGCDDYV